MKDLLPVLLGSDANVYGMARSFYMEYGVTSLAIGKGALAATANSKLVKMAVVEPNLEDDAVFVRSLTDFAKAHTGKTLVLVSCGDNYTGLMARARAALEPYYKFACPTPELVAELDTKEFFYQACERHGLSYPRTFGCTNENYKTVELPFPFPCIIKASNSVAYWNCKFPHKKKVFVAYNKEEFDAITAAIYSSSYQDNLVLQEYIPGDDNCMRVLNCYSGLDHKVKLMALGRPLLEEQTPEGIGNYAAIMNVRDDELMEKMKAFLEDVGWEGFSNFDMKYDARDGKYKLFEMNPRPACMTANPAVPSRRRCRRGKSTGIGSNAIGNCWRMSGWRGRIGISDIKANKITPACEPMAVQFTCWGDFFAIFNYCCSVSRLICLSKSELIRWVRLNTSYSAKAFCCACAWLICPLSGRISYRRNARNSLMLAANCSMVKVFSRSIKSSM